MDATHNIGIGSLQETENDVFSHSVDLFKPPSRELGLKRGRTIAIRPLDLNSNGPFNFIINPNGSHYVQLSATRLFIQCKITKGDGTNITDANSVAPVNLFAHTLFKGIEVEVNGNLVTDISSASSNYKAYIETLLSYGSEAKKTHLIGGMFSQDSHDFYDVLNNNNSGFKVRASYINDSRSFQLLTPLCSDFIQTDRLIPPNMSIKINLIRASDAFCLLSEEPAADYSIKFEDMKLYVRLIELDPAIVNYHNENFLKTPVIYPVNKTIVKNFVIPMHQSAVNIPNVFQGKIPKTIIIGLVSAKAYNGTFDTNPYNFQHFKCRHACIKVNGETIPADPYTPDFDRSLYMRSYIEFFNNVGIGHENSGNAITFRDFSGGSYFQAYDLSPDTCNGFHFHNGNTGNVEIEMMFKEALTEPVTILVYAAFDSVVLIDKDGNVTTNIG